MRPATITSRILRSKVTLSPTSRFFATCCVMVEPPWRLSPPMVFMKARVTLRTSTPWCSKKRLSSAATNAFCTNSGTSASGTQCRRLSGSNSSANLAPVPSSTVVMPGSLRPFRRL